MKRTISTISLISIGLLLAGCATVEKRIEKNLGYFNELSVADQAKIRDGQIDIGFKKPMVELALGPPATIKRRQTVDGAYDIWIYNGVKTEFVYPNCSPYYGGGLHYGRRGVRGYGHYHPVGPVARPKSYESARVIFEAGVVKEVEQLTPRG